MRRAFQKLIVAAWLAGVAGLATGCVGAALLAGAGAGAGGYGYSEGISRVIYPLSYERVWNDSMAMLRDQQIGVRDANRGADKGKIDAVRPDNTPVTLRFEMLTTEQTRVAIQVGTVPDRSAAESLHRALAKRLHVQLPF